MVERVYPRPRQGDSVEIRSRKKEKAKALGDPEGDAAAGKAPRGRSTALTVRPIPEDALVLIPMRNAVLFPGVISPITIGRPASIAAANEASRNNLKVGFVLQRDPQLNEVGPSDLHRVGTAGRIVRYAGMAGGASHLMVQGEQRCPGLEVLAGWPFLVASVVWIPEAAAPARARRADLHARLP